MFSLIKKSALIATLISGAGCDPYPRIGKKVNFTKSGYYSDCAQMAVEKADGVAFVKFSKDSGTNYKKNIDISVIYKINGYEKIGELELGLNFSEGWFIIADQLDENKRARMSDLEKGELDKAILKISKNLKKDCPGLRPFNSEVKLMNDHCVRKIKFDIIEKHKCKGLGSFDV